VEKAAIRDALVERLRAECDKARASADETRKGATHEESRAENDKDTRGLEASYLARGQAKRVEELEEAITRVRVMELPDYTDRPVGLGALVEALVDGDERTFFLAPAGGGEKLEVDRCTIHVLTPASPVGRALIGKRADDELELRIARQVRFYELTDVR
jgi:transcription elongation GreA/GreB family factor